MRLILPLAILTLLSACVSMPAPAPLPGGIQGTSMPAQQAIANFAEVVARVEPVAEAVCRAETPQQNCDFAIVIERDPRAGINAFQTLDPRGRPYVIFTLGLIAEARNTDELAFVMGHEAAHHIAQHIAVQRASAREGATRFGEIARSRGESPEAIREAVELGGLYGSRRFSQEHELEADAIGTVIAWHAGFDPMRGAEFFNRLPDPGAQFLGTHPPNAARRSVVARTLAELRN